MELHGVDLTQQSKKLLWKLIAFEICLVVIFLAETLAGSPSATLHRLFDLEAELTIPAWFSTVQLFVVGMVFLFKKTQIPADEKSARRCLTILGAGFVFLSADESAGIHEQVTVMLSKVAWMPRFHGNHGIWIFVYAAIGLGVLALIFPGLLSIWKNDRPAALMIAGGFGTLLLGGVGFEIIGYEYPTGSLFHSVESAMEEFLEMAGSSVLLCGALRLAPEKLKAASHATARLREQLPA
jgi:hypothetical protein